MKKLIGIIFLTALSQLLVAQDATIEAYAPNLVEVGEQFSLSYTLNTKPKEFIPPSITGFDILAGPSTSSSTSIEVINGKVTQSHTFTYSYVLVANKEGKFTIDPAEAVVGNKRIRSNPISIEVIKSSPTSSQTTASTGRQSANAESNNLPDDELFVTVEVNRKSAYIGQPIEAVIKIYTRVGILNFEDAKFPSFEGFWSQEQKSSPNVNFHRANVNGKIYNAGEIRRYVLFPQKADKITIDPFELIVIYQGRATRPRSIFDEFFGGGYETFRKRLVSKPITINIKPLPKPEPKDFVGAVGKFKLDVSVDKTEVKANDAFTYKIKVSGSGNLKLIGAPTVKFPSSFEVFDPKISDNVKLSGSNASGSKTFEYVCIPRAAGEYSLEPFTFSFFDPVKGKYVTLKSKPFNIKVLADSSASSNMVVASYGKEDIKYVGKDIRYIKTSSSKFKTRNSFWIVSGYYQFLYLLLLAIFIVLSYVYRRYRSKMQDVAFVRNRRASKIAQKRLKLAKELLEDNKSAEFFEEIHKAIWGYIADKLNLSLATLNLENVTENLRRNSIDDEKIEQLRSIIETCEYARFAPVAQHSQMTDIYDRTFKLIEELESLLKNKVKN
jgi:uncharacterized membrane protein